MAADAPAPTAPALTVAEFEDIVRRGLPMAVELGVGTLALERGRAVLRVPYHGRIDRPGGTVAGPVMFALADVALYGAVLSCIGKVELAVTTSMTINFLRRPGPKAVLAEARILKLGRRLAYGDILIRSEGEDDPVAHATGTYAIPPETTGAAPG